MYIRPFSRAALIGGLLLVLLFGLPATVLAATFSGRAPLAVAPSESLSNVTVQVQVADPTTITRASMVLDGVPKIPYVAYAGHWEWDDWDEWWVEDRTQATVGYRYPAPVTIGSHDVTVTVTNGLGETSVTAWSFVVSPPETTFSSPAPADGTTITTWKPALGLSVYDPATLSDGPVVTIDGTSRAVPMLFGTSRITYAEWEESQYNDLPGQQAVADFRIGFVTFTPTKLADGPHSVSVRVANPTGRTATYGWSFSVAAPPVISGFVPANASSVSTQSPVISARVEDNATLSPESVRMLLDGVAVPAAYDPATFELSYAPASPLANDRVHTVRVEAIDAGGLASSAEATFTVQIYSDMPVSTDCQSCHDATQHPMDDCNACHGPIPIGHGLTNDGVSRCLQCHHISGHGPNVIGPGVTWGGGDEPQEGYTGYWGNYCTYCHSVNYPTVPRHPADVASFHDTDGDMGTCAPCHVKSLTREHNRYTGSTGDPLGCGICHDPTASTAVRTAVATGDTSCGACHTSANHESLHSVTVADACAGCHPGTSLTPIHSTIGCAGCHESTDTRVIAAIDSGQRTCESCHAADSHQTAHMATLTSGSVTVFNYGHWGAPVPIVRNVPCTMCHASMNLISEHGGSCAVCHEGTRPAESFDTWNKGCQQGACHPTIDHAPGESGHVSIDCETCHTADWSVPYSNCDGCHNPSAKAPVTTSNVKTAYTGPASITLSAPGIAWTYYRLDGGAQTSCSSLVVPAPASGTAAHVIEYWSVDDSGREELPHKTANFTITADTAPPVTTSDAKLSYLGPATITLKATDNNAAPILGTYWRLDGGAQVKGTTIAIPQPASGQQNHVLEFWSVDAAGNEELPHKSVAFTVIADTTAPVGSIAINGGATYTTSGAVVLSLSASDAGGSGVTQMRFSPDGVNWGSWVAYYTSQRFTLATGTGQRTAWVQYRDVAGNIGTFSDNIIVDNISPTGSVTINGGASSTDTTTVTLTLSANDALSGVASMRLSNDAVTWSAWEPYATSRQWLLAAGTGTRYTYAEFKDGAGNVKRYSDSITLTVPVVSQ